MAEHNELGKQGEKIAEDFLKNKGFAILERNWHFGHKEVDLIARKDNMIVVAEIKTRSGIIFGEPEEFVTREKQKHLVKAANAYVQKKSLDAEVRFDIISIVFTGPEHYRINHIPDAFYPTM